MKKYLFLIIFSLSYLLSCDLEPGPSTELCPQSGFNFEVNGLSVSFNNSSSNDPTTYNWDFGDGNNSSLINPSHTYNQDDTYTVILTVSNNCGSDSDQQTVTVSENLDQCPIAAFSSQTDGLEVIFIDESTNNPTDFIWNFGDESSISNDQDPVHSYLDGGSYTVILIVSNQCGNDTITNEINVIPSTEDIQDDLLSSYDSLKSYIEFLYLFDAVISNRVFIDNSWNDMRGHSYTASSDKINELWTRGFGLIYRFNGTIRDAEQYINDALIEQRITSQARFLRGLVYYYLLNYFGDYGNYDSNQLSTPNNGIPIEILDSETETLSRSTIAQVRDFLKVDLENAISSIPEVNDLNITVEIIQGLLGRILIQTGDWGEVTALAGNIITGGKYLLEEVSDIYSASSEEIFLGFNPTNNTAFNVFFGKEFIPIMRYAEMFILRAQSSSYFGDFNAGLEYVNILRARRGEAPFSSLTNEKFLSVWRLELSKEGILFFAMKRLGLAISELDIQPFRSVLPIPIAVIEKHPTTMVQNIGYF